MSVTVQSVTVEPTELDISKMNPDSDGDGHVSKIEREIYTALKAADKDGSGSIGVKELYGVIESLVVVKRANKNMGRIIAALLVAIILALASIFATNIIAGEAIKESKIPDCSDPTVSDVRCNPTGLTHVGTVESYATSIFNLPNGPTNQLSKIENLAVYIDMTAGPEGGVAESTFKIVGAVKSSTTVATFYTPNGFTIRLDSEAQSGTITMDGQTYPVLAEPPVQGRQLVTNEAPMLDTVSGRQLANYHQDKAARRQLQFGGGGFGGALLTAGSFTMMAASGGFRRKLAEEMPKTDSAGRKLQFGGGGFGGALLTTGSFTMMAASGGF